MYLFSYRVVSALKIHRALNRAGSRLSAAIGLYQTRAAAIAVKGAAAGLFHAGAEKRVLCSSSHILLLQQPAEIWGEPGHHFFILLAVKQLGLFTASCFMRARLAPQDGAVPRDLWRVAGAQSIES